MRGQCGREGNTTEKGVITDLKKIGEFLNNRKTEKYGFGWSFGPALLLKLANFVDFKKIVLHNPFSQMLNVVKERTKLHWLVSPLLIDKWDNMKAIKNLNSDLIIVASKNDQNINNENSEELVKYNNRAKLVLLEGETHFSISKLGPKLDEYFIKYILL